MSFRRLLLATATLFGGCVDEDTLSVYGLAERYLGSLTLGAGDCQREGWGLAERPSLTLELKQTESGGLELWLEGSERPLYAQLCRLEDERPAGLCLYGRHLTTYQVSAPIDGRSVSCLLWSEVTELADLDPCCEQVSRGALNTLRVGEGGDLEGELEQQLHLSTTSERSADEARCGGPISCHYRATLQMTPAP